MTKTIDSRVQTIQEQKKIRSIEYTLPSANVEQVRKKLAVLLMHTEAWSKEDSIYVDRVLPGAMFSTQMYPANGSSPAVSDLRSGDKLYFHIEGTGLVQTEAIEALKELTGNGADYSQF